MTDLNITIRRQKRRSMMMRPVPGGLEVYIPHWMSEQSAEVQGFIAKGRARFAGSIPLVPEERTPLAQIQAMVPRWAARMQVQASRVQFRDMRRKWGSCSSKGSITLNTRLTWLPEDVAEYVVVHELAHLIELNHSKAFWSLLGRYLPDYAARQAALRRFEQALW